MIGRRRLVDHHDECASYYLSYQIIPAPGAASFVPKTDSPRELIELIKCCARPPADESGSSRPARFRALIRPGPRVVRRGDRSRTGDNQPGSAPGCRTETWGSHIPCATSLFVAVLKTQRCWKFQATSTLHRKRVSGRRRFARPGEGPVERQASLRKDCR